MDCKKENPIDFLKTYTVAQIEYIAACHLKLFKSKLSIPVDIDLLLELTEGVQLDIWPKLAANHSLLGMVGTDENGTICVYIDDDLADAAHKVNIYRTTVAEELSHILLHRQVIERVRNPEDFVQIQRHPNWKICDRNAKRLAAALLMPAGHVLSDSNEFYTEIVTKVGFLGAEPIQKQLTTQLAKKYQVSFEAMKYRLTEWPIKVTDRLRIALEDKLDFLPECQE